MSQNNIVFQMNMVPDFSDIRFQYLGEKGEDRKTEVVKKQMQMIRRFHDLGNQWSISMRIQKRESHLRLLFVFHFLSEYELTEEEKNQYAVRMKGMFPTEYTFEPLEEDEGDISWANYSGEVFKQEEIYEGNIADYYSCSLWTGMPNDLRMLCSAMMSQKGDSVVECTLIPTEFLPAERQWVNNCALQLKDVQMGERIKNEEGKTLKQFEPIPLFSIPLDNYNKMMKRYETSKVFFSSIRIFSEDHPADIASALLNGAVRNQGDVVFFRKGEKEFYHHVESYENVDISSEISSTLWKRMGNDLPPRTRRFHQLCDVEEISNFVRLPLSVEKQFPGFAFDTGFGSKDQKKKAGLYIELGNYIDDPSGLPVPADFHCRQLAKHGLVVGVPGSGKTTAMFNILHQLWDAPEEERIPFIVMEPAKTEFRALKTIPHFRKDMLVFTLGDERVSPFRFNPFEVLPGIPLERHISRLNACFVGAFDLFDPLPLLLDQAIRKTYMEKGWYEDSLGGEPGAKTPTLTDLCRNAEQIVNESGFDSKMVSDFKASLLQRLNSLRRGSKGRMLDTEYSIPMEELMGKPIILELDALNEDEKSLMMMFLLSFVFEYCKVKRKSGMPLKHMLLVEEAHNLIGEVKGSEGRANPKEQTIKLFVNMLAEMRALGEGILIADQLPTAIASQAVKQTNVKILMRVTSRDDREEIGNTMDLTEKEMKDVVHFKTGHAYVFHEGLDQVRMVRMTNYKDKYGVAEPPDDGELHQMMEYYEKERPDIYLPYADCSRQCKTCNRRVRSQAERFAESFFTDKGKGSFYQLTANDRMYKKQDNNEARKPLFPKCTYCILGIKQEKEKIIEQYGRIGDGFAPCAFIHLQERAKEQFSDCSDCPCTEKEKDHYFEMLKKM